MNVTADSPANVVPLASVRSAAGWYRLTIYLACTFLALLFLPLVQWPGAE